MTTTKTKMTTTLLACLALLALAGCQPEDGGAAPAGCAQPCAYGQVCVQGMCINDPSQPTQPPTTPPPTQPTSQCNLPMQPCGSRCVDFMSDPLNCGGCGMACGARADCVLGKCTCAPNASDCNGSPTDGCECAGQCDSNNPTQCATTSSNAQCDPTNAGTCAGNDKYCDTSSGTPTCQSCPSGFVNCDGTWGCECKGSCNGNQCHSATSKCDASQSHSCGSSGAFCDTSSKSCQACPNGFSNCDGTWGCECQGTCGANGQCQSANTTTQPSGPPCSTSQYNACGDSTWYCDPQTSRCTQCSNGLFGLGKKRNCDGLGGCETSGECTNTSTGDCRQNPSICQTSGMLCNQSNGQCYYGSNSTDCRQNPYSCSQYGQQCNYSTGQCTGGNTSGDCRQNASICTQYGQQCNYSTGQCTGGNTTGDCRQNASICTQYGQQCNYSTGQCTGGNTTGDCRQNASICTQYGQQCDYNTGQCTGGNTNNNGRWNIYIVSATLPPTFNGQPWDTGYGAESMPDIQVRVAFDTFFTYARQTSTQHNTTTAYWNAGALISGKTDYDVKSTGLNIRVGDIDQSYVGSTFTQAAQCTYRLPQHIVTTTQMPVNCGQSTVTVRFERAP